MECRLYKQILNPWATCLAIFVWAFISALLGAADLPSGLPDDLSDMSAYNPCLGTFYGASPPRCPWYVQADALWLKRDRIDRVPIAALTTPDNIVFSTQELDSPFRAGPRVLVGHTIGETRWQVDVTYFLVDSWDDTATMRDSTPNGVSLGNLFSPFTNFGDPPIYGYDFNNYVSIREFSQLQNGELNLRYLMPMPHECLTAKFILGLRYMSINEQLDYQSQSTVPLAVGTLLTTRTTNDLIGPQIGGDFNFYAYRQCWINLEIKGAICANRALQETAGVNVVTPIGNRDSRDATSFVGDLDLELVWQITPRLITRVGYQAIWLTDIAMAARNFGQPASILENGDAYIETGGHPVYHGPHLGLEYTW
jgi:hypothetical protein